VRPDIWTAEPPNQQPKRTGRKNSIIKAAAEGDK